MMNKSTEKFLQELGLTPEEAQVYLALVHKGPLTALELSRSTHINRTKIYRLLEKLQTDGVVEDIVDEYRHLAKAVDIHSLEGLVKKQEARTAYLRESFPKIAHLLAEQSAAENPQTKVLFYKGKDGIGQMLWHTLRAKGEMCSYTYRSMEEIATQEWGERWQAEWIKRKLVLKELYSDEYVASMQGKSKQRISGQTSDFFVSRYIPSSVLDIKHQVDIYNDVVAYYNWHEGEVFGVEIYNQKVADMQRQLFTLAWNTASRQNVKLT